MVKKILLSLGLTSLVVSGALACTPGGCTPGFWKQKQHIEQWKKNKPGDSYGATFGVGTVPDLMEPDVIKKAYDNFENVKKDNVLDLGEALWLKGKGNTLNQLARTSTASLLNLNADLMLSVVIGGKTIKLKGAADVPILYKMVQAAFTGWIDAEELKDALDEANNAGCPF